MGCEVDYVLTNEPILSVLQLLTRAENEAKNMNLNKVCLCFEAFHLIGDTWVSICEPALSNPINNMSK